jgi:hypothetical protein
MQNNQTYHRYTVAKLERMRTRCFDRFDVAVSMHNLPENPRSERDGEWAQLWWNAAHLYADVLESLRKLREAGR